MFWECSITESDLWKTTQGLEFPTAVPFHRGTIPMLLTAIHTVLFPVPISPSVCRVWGVLTTPRWSLYHWDISKLLSSQWGHPNTVLWYYLSDIVIVLEQSNLPSRARKLPCTREIFIPKNMMAVPTGPHHVSVPDGGFHSGMKAVFNCNGSRTGPKWNFGNK